MKYGHRFTSNIAPGTLAAIQREWAESLGGIPAAGLRRAVDQCIDKFPSWPPTVGEFKKLCEVDFSEAGLPSLEKAWCEISSMNIKVTYSHGIVLAARNDERCDFYNWRLMPMDKSLVKFKPIYLDYVARAMAGEKFDLPLMLENKIGLPVTKAERLSAHSKWFNQLKGAIN